MKKNTIKAAVCAVSHVLFLVLILCGIALVVHYAPEWLKWIFLAGSILSVFVDAFLFFEKEIDEKEEEGEE